MIMYQPVAVTYDFQLYFCSVQSQVIASVIHHDERGHLIS